MKTTKLSLLIVIFLAASINLCAQTAEEWKKSGNAELDSTNYRKAIEYYEKAIEVDSNYYDAYHNLGLVYSIIKEFDKAIEYYSKAMIKKDSDANTFFALGGIYADMEDYDNAIEMFKRGISIKPNSPEEHSYLSFLYGQKNSFTYELLYAKKAALLGDTLAQQLLTDNEISWENTFIKPNYEQIKINIENERSDFYYSKIWDKYQLGDSTMTLEEKRHLYYGYVFNDKYSPYLSGHDAEQVNDILNKEEPTNNEYEKLVSLLNTSLSVEPFNCRYLYYQSVAYNALGKPIEAAKNLRKIQCVFDALISTGDGLEEETAIHVIAVSNEYDYLFLNNLSMQSQSLMDGGYDVLYLKINENGLDELWFDVNQCLNFLGKTFE